MESLNEIAGPKACKETPNTGVFMWILRNSYEHLFYRTPPAAASEIGKNKKKLEYFETGKRKKTKSKKRKYQWLVFLLKIYSQN